MTYRGLLLLSLLFAPFALPQEASPPAPKAKVNAIFARYNRTDTPGCSAGVSLAGKPVLAAAYGMADLEHALALTPHSIFEAGSVSKQFTAAAVLLLARQGKLSLDDPVRKYIPELPDYGTPLTIRHLLHHTSGLRDWGSVAAIGGWPRTTRAYTHAHVLEIIGRQRALNYPPGAAYSYTNSGYNLAAMLVTRVAAKPFTEFTRDAIFSPLGMKSTSWRDDYRRIVPGRAIAYSDTEGTVQTLMPFENVHGNGGLLTTIHDLLRWNENFKNPQVGGSAFVQQQHIRGRLTNGHTIFYAAGLVAGNYRGLNEVSHSGATAGYRAWLGRYPDQGVSVAVLCNATSANAPQLGHDVAALYLKDALHPPPAPANPAPDVSAFTGMYRSAQDHSAVHFTLSEGKLQMEKTALQSGSAGVFTIGQNTQVKFDLDAAGKAVKAHIQTPNGGHVLERMEPWTPTPQDLEAITGEYASEEAEVSLTVALEDEGLVVRRRPDAKLPLRPTYKDGFENEELGSVRFLRNTSGQVTELSIGNGRVWDIRFPRLR